LNTQNTFLLQLISKKSFGYSLQWFEVLSNTGVRRNFFRGAASTFC